VKALSDRTRSELDRRDPDQVLELLLEYWADCQSVNMRGQRKLVAIFENGRLRTHFFEFRGGRDIAHVPPA
jgi:hypothetical protein